MDIISSESSSPSMFMVNAAANILESMLMASSRFCPSCVIAVPMASSRPVLICSITCVMAAVIWVSRFCATSPVKEDIMLPTYPCMEDEICSSRFPVSTMLVIPEESFCFASSVPR